MLDLLIKAGTVVDGTGCAPRVADVGVREGKVVAVRPELGAEAREVVDAAGLLVTPGFIDIHTHYDGQVTWDDQLLPSANHGVTTVVMGNCGVGFAPVRPGREEWLIGLMEGVEDIPGSALSDGIQWGWETFPDYLEFLSTRRFAMDVAALVPHGPLRAYSMGGPGADNLPAGLEDTDAMSRHVRESIEAGAVGFSSSRINAHQAVDGRPVPGTTAQVAELVALGKAMTAAGGGTLELITGGLLSELPGIEKEAWTAVEEIGHLRRFMDETGCPVTYSLFESPMGGGVFPSVLEATVELIDLGYPIHPQFSGRPVGILSGLQAYHAFQARPTYRALAHLPLEERAARMAHPEVKRSILEEADIAGDGFNDNMHLLLRKVLPITFPLEDPLDYEPEPDDSITDRASRSGQSEMEYLYDYLLSDNGSATCIALVGEYSAGDLRVTESLMRQVNSVIGLGDAGAHVHFICDASIPTSLLTHWARDRARGPRLPVELLVKKQTSDNASLYRMHDRGTVAPGQRADLNVVDASNLSLGLPYAVSDLPGGTMRFLQDSHGYRLTMVGGTVTRRDDTDTGARPGRLYRCG